MNKVKKEKKRYIVIVKELYPVKISANSPEEAASGALERLFIDDKMNSEVVSVSEIFEE